MGSGFAARRDSVGRESMRGGAKPAGFPVFSGSVAESVVGWFRVVGARHALPLRGRRGPDIPLAGWWVGR